VSESEIRIGSFRVEETLGTGALATIYRAVQEPVGRVVALKALKTQIAPGSSFAEQLEREAKVLADLVHPNVVLLLDSGRTPAGRPYLVLEHVDGPSLERVLAKKKKLSVDTALAIGAGVCAGLEHAHARGVIHRDVKPSNLLLASTGVVKLIDFGIAQRARSPSISDTLGAEGITPSGRLAPEQLKDAFGTPAYMSPEQILGDFVDGRSDLFSLGVVLYQMLTGVRPFEGGGGGRSMRRDTPRPVRDLAPQVPRATERMVMRLLEKSPNDRYPNASMVLERLQAQLRAQTREDPNAIVRGALVETGFLTREKRTGSLADAGALPRAANRGLVRAIIGFAVIGAAFAVSIIAIEGTSWSSSDRRAGERPLELVPEQGGGLRVVATPWAYVKVDGQQVETTPFARPIPLPPGKHFVTLSHPDAPSIEREVVIAPGEISSLDVTLDVNLDAGADAR
jgi:eukaryotic-like serine/threonine-protein kinase